MDENIKSTQNRNMLALIATCITGLCAIIATILSISFHLEKNKPEHDNEIFIQTIFGFVKIRSAPDSSSYMIGTAPQGEKYLILDTVYDANGYEWYQVPVGDEIGYIRSDLGIITK